MSRAIPNLLPISQFFGCHTDGHPILFKPRPVSEWVKSLFRSAYVSLAAARICVDLPIPGYLGGQKPKASPSSS